MPSSQGENWQQQWQILVVDDMGSMRDLIAMTLRDIGFSNIILAANGREACKLNALKRFDLILCDWNMPEVTGLDVLRSVRRSAHTPFIMITAEAETNMVKSAIAEGVSDYLVKPFSPEALMAKIKRIHNTRKDSATI